MLESVVILRQGEDRNFLLNPQHDKCSSDKKGIMFSKYTKFDAKLILEYERSRNVRDVMFFKKPGSGPSK